KGWLGKKQQGGGKQGWQPCQPHPGTRRYRYGCSLPGLTGFTANRCEGTDRVAITNPTDAGRAIVTACPQVTSRFFSCNHTGMCGIGHPPADERWPAGVGILSRYHLQETLHATCRSATAGYPPDALRQIQGAADRRPARPLSELDSPRALPRRRARQPATPDAGD